MSLMGMSIDLQVFSQKQNNFHMIMAPEEMSEAYQSHKHSASDIMNFHALCAAVHPIKNASVWTKVVD